MTPTSTKKFSEILNEDTSFYSSAIAFNFNTTTNTWQQTSIAESTKELLYEEFCDRYVCNDTKFKRLFIKALNRSAYQYALLRRNELTIFDPLVADYMEEQEIEQATTTSIGNKNTSDSKTTTGTSNITNNKSGSEATENTDMFTAGTQHTTRVTRTPDIAETTTTTGMDTKQATEMSSDIQVSKQAPMSAEYNGATVGEIPNLDWSTLTAQQQAKHSGTSNETNSTSNTDRKTQTGSEVTVTTESPSGSDERNEAGEREWSEIGSTIGSTSGSETATGSISESGNIAQNSINKVISTGRSGLTPQDALLSANTYIRNTNAATWLIKQVSNCFRAVTYDPEEEWLY